MAAQDDARRRVKEAFVTGHAGASLWENEEVIVIAVLCYAAWRSLAVHLPNPSLVSRLLAEFSIIIVPLLLSITRTVYNPLLTLLLSTAFIVGLIVPARPTTTYNAVKPSIDGAHTHKPFSVALRASLQLLTVAAILAVDFNVFPRKFAKTESYGTSLMDLGVGSFMFSNGFVAGPRLKAMTSWKEGMRNLAKSFRISVPVLVLGAVRLALTRGVNYQEHVTEYGAHWNFFITLGLIPVFTAVIQLLVPRVNFALVGTAIVVIYEEVLRRGLEDYIMTAPRSGSLFQLNREGICSFFGYWAIFLIAAHMGQMILSDDILTEKDKSPDKRMQRDRNEDDWSERSVMLLKTIIELISNLCVLLVMFALARDRLGIQVSRRMANASYVLWILASMTSFLLLAGVADFVVESRHGDASLVEDSIPIIFSSINRNQLAAFLLANLLTGLVNLSIDTIAVPDEIAFVILTIYMAIICTIAVLCRNIKLKLNGQDNRAVPDKKKIE